MVKAAFGDLIGGAKGFLGNYQALVGMLSANEQKSILYTLIEIVSKLKLQFGSSSDKAKSQVEAEALGASAALVAAIVESSSNLQASLTDWLVSLPAVAPAQSHHAHRAVIAVVANSKGASLIQILVFR